MAAASAHTERADSTQGVELAAQASRQACSQPDSRPPAHTLPRADALTLADTPPAATLPPPRMAADTGAAR